MCYVEPAPIYGYLFINVIHIHFDQYCCLCLLSFLACQDWEGDLHSHGTYHWWSALWANEGPGDHGRDDQNMYHLWVYDYVSSIIQGSLNFPIWWDQTMQMCGKCEGFPFEWCIVLGWYYNDPCNSIIYCTSRFVHPSQERCRIRWVLWAGVMRSSLSPLWETPVVWVFFQFWQQVLIFEL